MSKPKSFDSWPPEKQEEWREKRIESARKWSEANPEKMRESARKHREANREKVAEKKRKYHEANRQQAAADQFFQIQGAAEQISEAIETKNNNTDDNNTDKPTSQD